MTEKAVEATGKDIQLEVAGGRAGGFAAGIAIGVLLGAAVALLFAPARGEVTRERLRRRLSDVRDYAEDEFDDLKKRTRKELKRRFG
jgi:gas vesicle protein